jgi:AcrR family transcriptional regulator
MSRSPRTVLGRQAQKTRRTRARLIAAAIGIISEHGYPAATATRIAQRAGVTWGAAQHQFGSKEAILDAILALAYRHFIAAMSAPALRHGSLPERARQFVERMWQHYQGDHYRVSLEILRATRSQRRRRARAWEQRQGRTHLRVVREVFHESQLSDARLREALTFTHCCVTGLAMEPVFETRVQHVPRHLRRIADALQNLLSA